MRHFALHIVLSLLLIRPAFSQDMEITEPKPGTLWEMEEEVTISWRNIDCAARLANIILYKGDRRIFQIDTDIRYYGTGSYTWKVPEGTNPQFTPGSDYYIEVNTSAGNSQCLGHSRRTGKFEIRAPVPKVPVFTEIIPKEKSAILWWGYDWRPTGFEIYTCSGDFVKTVDRRFNTTLEELQSERTYSYKIRAFNATGRSSFSECISFQTLAESILSIDQSRVELSAETGEFSLNISNLGKGEMNWQAEVSLGGAWMSLVSESSGLDDGSVRIKYDRNVTGVRNGIITIKAGDARGAPTEIPVYQEAADCPTGWGERVIQPQSTVFYGELSLEGHSFEAGDLVGAFVNDELTGIGYLTIYDSRPVVVMNIQGRSAQIARFRYWDKSECKEKIVSETYTLFPQHSVGTDQDFKPLNIQTLPDLVVQKFTSPIVPEMVQAGVYDLSVSISNRGNEPALAVPLKIYLSKDQLWDENDSLLAEQQLSPLAVNASQQLDFQIQIPANQPLGDYHIIAEIPAGEGAEISTDNNALSSGTSIVFADFDCAFGDGSDGVFTGGIIDLSRSEPWQFAAIDLGPGAIMSFVGEGKPIVKVAGSMRVHEEASIIMRAGVNENGGAISVIDADGNIISRSLDRVGLNYGTGGAGNASGGTGGSSGKGAAGCVTCAGTQYYASGRRRTVTYCNSKNGAGGEYPAGDGERAPAGSCQTDAVLNRPYHAYNAGGGAAGKHGQTGENMSFIINGQLQMLGTIEGAGTDGKQGGNGGNGNGIPYYYTSKGIFAGNGSGAGGGGAGGAGGHGSGIFFFLNDPQAEQSETITMIDGQITDYSRLQDNRAFQHLSLSSTFIESVTKLTGGLGGPGGKGGFGDLSKSPRYVNGVDNSKGYYAESGTAGGKGNHGSVEFIPFSSPVPKKIVVDGDPILSEGDSVVLKTYGSTSLEYQWFVNGDTIQGAVHSQYTAKSKGNYQVKVRNGSCIHEFFATPIGLLADLRLNRKHAAISSLESTVRLDLDLEVGNSGPGAVDQNFKLTYYLSPTDSIGEKSIKVGEQQVSNLSPNDERALTQTLALASDVPIFKYLVISIDSDENIVESNELNNLESVLIVLESFQCFDAKGPYEGVFEGGVLSRADTTYLEGIHLKSGEEMTFEDDGAGVVIIDGDLIIEEGAFLNLRSGFGSGTVTVQGMSANLMPDPLVNGEPGSGGLGSCRSCNPRHSITSHKGGHGGYAGGRGGRGGSSLGSPGGAPGQNGAEGKGSLKDSGGGGGGGGGTLGQSGESIAFIVFGKILIEGTINGKGTNGGNGGNGGAPGRGRYCCGNSGGTGGGGAGAGGGHGSNIYLFSFQSDSIDVDNARLILSGGDAGVGGTGANNGTNGERGSSGDLHVIRLSSIQTDFIQVFGSQEIIQDDSVVLSVNIGSNVKLQWFKDSIALYRQTSGQLAVTESGLYHARLTNAEGCSLDTDPVRIEVIGQEGVIPSFYPKWGNEGDTVIISGADFETTLSANLVQFNQVNSEVIKASSNSLKVLVPSGVSGRSFLTITTETDTQNPVDFFTTVRTEQPQDTECTGLTPTLVVFKNGVIDREKDTTFLAIDMYAGDTMTFIGNSSGRIQVLGDIVIRPGAVIKLRNGEGFSGGIVDFGGIERDLRVIKDVINGAPGESLRSTRNRLEDNEYILEPSGRRNNHVFYGGGKGGEVNIPGDNGRGRCKGEDGRMVWQTILGGQSVGEAGASVGCDSDSTQYHVKRIVHAGGAGGAGGSPGISAEKVAIRAFGRVRFEGTILGAGTNGVAGGDGGNGSFAGNDYMGYAGAGGAGGGGGHGGALYLFTHSKNNVIDESGFTFNGGLGGLGGKRGEGRVIFTAGGQVRDTIVTKATAGKVGDNGVFELIELPALTKRPVDIYGDTLTFSELDVTLSIPMKEQLDIVWFKDGEPIPNSFYPFINARESGTYYAHVLDNEACLSITEEVQLKQLNLSEIDSIKPDSGDVDVTTQVTIYGGPFYPDGSINEFRFGAALAKVVAIYQDSAVVESPMGIRGEVDVSVFTLDSLSLEKDRYKVLERVLMADSSIHLSNTNIHTSRNASFWLKNEGNNKLIIDSMKVAHPWSLPKDYFNIAPGDSVEVQYVFEPTDTIFYKTDLNIHSNLTSGRSTVKLYGEGRWVDLLAKDYNFGSIEAYEYYSIYLKLAVVGNDSLTVKSLNIPPGYEVQLQDSAVLAGDSILLKVDFKPQNLASTFEGYLLIESDANNSVDSVHLKGIAKNSLPISASYTLNGTEDSTIHFTPDLFPFEDKNDTSFAKIKFEPPSSGILYIDADDDGSYSEKEIQTTSFELSKDSLSLLKFQPAPNEYGETYATMPFRLSDPYDYTVDTYGITFEIVAVNDTPYVTAPSQDLIAFEDSLFVHQFPYSIFADVDDDSLSIVVTEYPGSFSYNAQTRELTGMANQTDVGEYELILKATDMVGAFITDTLLLRVENVNDVPQVQSAQSDLISYEDSLFEYTVPTHVFTDEDGDSLTITATGFPETRFTFNEQTGLLSGTAIQEDVAEYALLFKATDAHNTYAIDTVKFIIKNVNDTPRVVLPQEDLEALEDTPFTYMLKVEAFEDDDGDSLTLDASGYPDNFSYNKNSGVLSGTALQSDVRSYSVLFSATDGMGYSVTDTVKLVVKNVNDAPELVSSIEDQQAFFDIEFTLNISTSNVTDEDGDDITITVAGLPESMSTDGNLTITGTPQIEEAGDYAISINYSDGNGGIVTDTFILNIGTPTSLELVREYGLITVSPNPFFKELLLSVEKGLIGQTAFELRTIDGKLAWSATKYLSGQTEVLLQINKYLPEGTYMLNVKPQGKLHFNWRLIKKY